jgi:predicted N-acetyltransferase YhbS
MKILPAEPGQHKTLTDLVIASKASWGYDAAFIADALPELQVTEEFLSHGWHFVAKKDEQILGFSSLLNRHPVLLLENLFVDPGYLRTGVGEFLWRHAVSFALERGYQTIILVSDPYAEGFYLRMGAETVGQAASGIRAGRMLPSMRFDLPR